MNIGTLIRKRRKEKKLTLKIVAEQASISEGFLSQVENDVNSPSVDTLIRICNALDVDAGNLLTQVSNKEKIILIRKADWDDIDLSHTGFVTRRFFSPDDRTVIDSSVLVIEPGKSIPVRKNIKNGQEVLCILKGSVELTLSDTTYQMVEGDSVHFWSNPEHQKITNNSVHKSFVLWVGTL
ncbi:helix-turn-helix domain-containing protein [Desulfopila inferna]|uniref:helix-turn-helix domain-containing protein n=1 Tax=Desulfopila inferna TaxID=468528 RepID=UPI0019649A2F|nr:helix-turn-helix transcriptional regulator [Desulfopila inferna]MBM9603732.1 helix-turn-helix domain-containing protein [Desulfopila inferna]